MPRHAEGRPAEAPLDETAHNRSTSDLTGSARNGTATRGAVATFDADVAREALDAYDGLGGQVVLGVTQPGPRFWRFPTTAASLDRAVDRAASLDAEGRPGIYVGGSTVRTDLERGRGGEGDTIALPALALDVDLLSPVAHKRDDLPPDRFSASEVLAELVEAGLDLPSEVVDSGHGLYWRWRLLDPVTDHALARKLLETLHAVTVDRMAARGWHSDDVSDLARIWRLPGSVNRKDPDDPRPVVVLDTADVYSAERMATTLQLAVDELGVKRTTSRPVPPKKARPATDTTSKLRGVSQRRPGPFALMSEGIRDGDLAWADLLEDVDYGFVRTELVDGFEVECWRRPGDPASDYSLKVGFGGEAKGVNWSPATGLPTGPGQLLSAGRIWAGLHGWSESEASRELLRAAHGRPATSAATGLPRTFLDRLAEATSAPRDDSPEDEIGPQNPQNPPAPESSGHSGDDFEATVPTPLGRDPEALSTAAAGPIVGPLADAIAEGLQVPADLAVNLALPLITTAARGRWTVQVAPGWTEVLGLATCSALASGERKSPVLKLLAGPLVEHERDRQAETRGDVAASMALRKLKTDQAENLRRAAVKIGDQESQGAYLDAERGLAELEDVVSPRWLVDDTTPERLVGLLGEQGGALGVVSTEPGLFAILAGRYSNGAANLEGVLKATSGDAVKVDRQGREPIVVDRPCLSLALCIQPGLLSDLGRGSFRASGLLARFLFVLPTPRVGRRQLDVEPVSRAVLGRWEFSLRALASAGEQEGARELRLDEDAAREFRGFRGYLEPLLHPHYGSLAAVGDWGAKLPGTVARIAGALTLLSDPAAEVITGATMAGAVTLGRGYAAHALAAFGRVHGQNDTIERAREVLGWLVRRGEPEVSVRELWQGLRGRSWVQDTDDVRAALKTLDEFGHVQLVEQERRAGRPSERYRVHPLDLAAPTEIHTQKPQNPPARLAPESSGHSGDETEAPAVERWRRSGAPVRLVAGSAS